MLHFSECVFDKVTREKIQRVYILQACIIISKKAQLPNNAKKSRQNFILTEEESKLAFTLPHKVSFESLSIQNFKFDTLYKQEMIANWILWAWWMHFLWQRIRNITPPFFLLPILKYLLETSRKLLFHNDKPTHGSQPSRYHYRSYNIVIPFTKLFDTNRKNTYLRLQKDACASEYRKFQTKSENLLSNRKKHCLNK